MSNDLNDGQLSGSGQAGTQSSGRAPASSPSVSLGDNSATAGLVANARSGDEDFLYGDDRAITNPPNWHSQRSTELYNGATMNNDPSTAQSASQDWMAQAEQLKDVADDLYRSITELGAVWVGQGSGAAQGALASIASSGSQAGSAARVMGDRMSRQAEAAADVKKMPPPKEFDADQATKAALAGGPAAMAADMKAQRDAAQAVKEEQVRYFNTYTAAMTDVDRSTPSFGPESLGLKPAAGSGVAGAGSVGAVGGPAPVGGRHAAPPAPAGYGPGAGGAADAPALGTGGGAAAASSVAAPTSGSGTVDASSAGAVPSGAGSSAGAGAGAGAGAASAAAAPSASQATPSASGSAAAALGGAALGGGIGLAGGRLAAGRQSGATRKDADESGEQGEYGELDAVGDSADDATDNETEVAAQRSGAVSTAGPAGSGVVPSNGTIGSTGAPMGAPMAGAAGAGTGGSDEEHTHASFLIEADPDDVFGANQATPPPVIGEWVDNDDES